MKKTLVGLSCVMALCAGISVTAAEVQPQTCEIGNCNVGECFMDSDCDGICGDHNFVDEDGDGICDNHCYIDADADGVCDHFVDDDTDGICDHCHEHGKAAQTDCTPRTTTPRTSSHHGNSHHGRSGHHGRCH